MDKERRILCDSSKRERDRVSPYPLRSSRNNKQQEYDYEYESRVESESSRQLQWEDVRCVICMEPPHNALLLQCASSSKGCRAYMCDTSARHSNCFKQFRRKNTNRLTLTRNTLKSPLKCPLCRGEVYGTMKLTCARRYMNAKPRCCTVDNCHFSGTYSQLKTHLKAQHQHLTQQRLDLWEQHMWEQLERERESERIQIQTQRRRLLVANTLHQHQHQLTHTPPLIHHLNFDDFLLHYFSASMENQPTTLLTTANYPTHIPRFDYITAHTYSTHITRFDYPPTIYPTWIP